MPLIKLAAERQKRQIPPGMQPPENAAEWFRIQNSADDADSTDVFVFDSIGGWFGLYADEFIQQLSEVRTSKINVRLNSPGGSVFEGIAIANAIRSHPAYVTVQVDGLAASIASVIMLAGDKVVMQPQSQVMIHAASGVGYGDAAEMLKMAEVLEFQTRNIAEAYAERTGRSVDEFLELMAAETWFTAREAVEIGLADEAAPMKKAQPSEDETVSARMQRTWDLSMYRHPGRAEAPAPKIHEPEPVVQAGAGRTPGEIGLLASGLSADGLVALIRNAVRQELAVLGGAVGAHATSVEDGTWDAGTHEGRLPSPVPVATARKVYGWYDSDAVEDGAVPKSACKLPHHFVSEDGTPGAASVNGVRNALARLPQTEGLSDSERATIEAHLKAHLDAYDDGSEDHVHDTDPEAVADEQPSPQEEPPTEPSDASPPFPPQKEDDEDDEDEEEEESPPDGDDDPANEADDWNQIVGFLVSTATSPSADDVFAQLKEGW